MNEITQARLMCLKEYLKQQGRLAVCYSGGVDSTFLLKVAHEHGMSLLEAKRETET